METVEVHCKTILTRTSGYLKKVCSHSLNPYAGCGFGRSSCGVGCYVRFNPWLSRGRLWGTFVDVKINAPAVYRTTCGRERDWSRKRGVPFTVFFSSSTDPWQPVERRYRVTRDLLKAMTAQPPDRLILQTHSTGIRDDLSLIGELSRRCELRVHISIEGDRDRLPGLPPPPSPLEDRIHLLEEFSRAGLKTIACLSPLYPMKNPEAFFARLAATGIRAVVIDHFIEGDGTPDGSRTYKSALPDAMARVAPESIHLPYRDAMARIARRHLPVGLSQAGFAGHYST